MHRADDDLDRTDAPGNRPSGSARSRRDGAGASASWALAAVAALTLLGAVLRLRLAGQPLFADELSTWWIVEGRSLRGVVATVATDAEITPPLYFALAWFGRRLGDAPELLRAPSWIAGIAMVPLVYALGTRTVGRTAALVATALTALGPFALYYAADARGYALMMAAVVVSTLAMLLAVDTGRRRWWGLHAVAVAVAVLSHYTSVFAFAAQLGWLLWAHPEARRSALAATAGAVVLFLPWTGGLLADLDSPTTQILAALSPLNWASVRFSLTHWAIGYPAAIAFGLDDFPGAAAVSMLALAALLAAAGVLVGAVRARPRVADLDRRMVLVVLLALSGPVATVLLDPLGIHLFSVRNLAASWPPATLGLAALLVAAGRRLSVAAVALALAAFAIAAVELDRPRFQNPDYAGAAGFVDRRAGPRDVVIDATGELSPGPATGLDVELERPHRLLRAAAPEVRDHPFTFADPVVALQDAIRRAVAEAGSDRILLVTTRFPPSVTEAQIATERARARRDASFPASHRLVERRTFTGVLGVEVRVYAPRAP